MLSTLCWKNRTLRRTCEWWTWLTLRPMRSGASTQQRLPRPSVEPFCAVHPRFGVIRIQLLWGAGHTQAVPSLVHGRRSPSLLPTPPASASRALRFPVLAGRVRGLTRPSHVGSPAQARRGGAPDPQDHPVQELQARAARLVARGDAGDELRQAAPQSRRRPEVPGIDVQAHKGVAEEGHARRDAG